LPELADGVLAADEVVVVLQADPDAGGTDEFVLEAEQDG
jgi:hypothetical protein